MGPNRVQTDSVELEGQTQRLIDNTTKEGHHFIADTFTPGKASHPRGEVDIKGTHVPTPPTAAMHVTLEPNEHFISFLVRDSTPLTHPSTIYHLRDTLIVKQLHI